jgi:hypothetical protein
MKGFRVLGGLAMLICKPRMTVNRTQAESPCHFDFETIIWPQQMKMNSETVRISSSSEKGKHG